VTNIARDVDGSEDLGKPTTATGRRVLLFEDKLIEREFGRSNRTSGDNIKMGIRK
jgi:hypothetical protein